MRQAAGHLDIGDDKIKRLFEGFEASAGVAAVVIRQPSSESSRESKSRQPGRHPQSEFLIFHRFCSCFIPLLIHINVEHFF